MEYCIKNVPGKGRIYYMTDGKTEVGVALDFGIRVTHLSCAGMENLYYDQPADLSDGFGTADTWKIRGGHRMWLAPEGLHSYHPDDDPVSYKTLPNGLYVEQVEDPIQHIVKSLTVTFEDGSVVLNHSFRNVGSAPIMGASWGINTLDGYGTVTVDFTGEGGFVPTRTVSLWGATNLHDSRIRFSQNQIIATNAPIPDYFKIGIYCKGGKAVYQNKGQQLTLTFDAPEMAVLPDGGCNFELYMGAKFMELEALGIRKEILPGESACHTERLTVERI
jgi:hypothetical protein